MAVRSDRTRSAKKGELTSEEFIDELNRLDILIDIEIDSLPTADLDDPEPPRSGSRDSRA